MEQIQNRADVVVIGGGIAGCATAYNLAKRGASVVLVEKGKIADEQSSRNWGWVSQLRNPVEAPLNIVTQTIWPTLTEELSADIEWVQAGNFYLAEDEKDFDRLSKQADAMVAAGLEVQMLSRKEAKEIIPEISGDWYGAYYNRKNGHADPAKTTNAFARAAQENGVKIYPYNAVENIELTNGAVSAVRTERGEIRTDVVVCAAGAWSRKVGQMVGLNLPQRSVRATVARTNPVPIFTQTNVWGGGVAVRQRIDGSLMVAGDGTADYDITLSSFNNLRLFAPALRRNWRDIRLKFGAEFFRDLARRMPWSEAQKHPFAHTVDIEPEPSAKKVRDGMNALVRLYPHLAGKVRVEKSWAGFIDGTPDRVPVISTVPEVKGFVFATGFSGHGFAMGPGTGLVTSEIVLDGKSSVDIHGMRYTRFAEGDLNPPQP